ncbi:unnamed protein product [Durusdinium trenchii]|uniref:Cyclic nucleotide-binding domain-containing protein n=1 Tax=Durusdinium trenchii TaxID=1381693 RepID=A0ABP0HRY5_9DINO
MASTIFGIFCHGWKSYSEFGIFFLGSPGSPIAEASLSAENRLSGHLESCCLSRKLREDSRASYQRLGAQESWRSTFQESGALRSAQPDIVNPEGHKNAQDLINLPDKVMIPVLQSRIEEVRQSVKEDMAASAMNAFQGPVSRSKPGSRKCKLITAMAFSWKHLVALFTLLSAGISSPAVQPRNSTGLLVKSMSRGSTLRVINGCNEPMWIAHCCNYKYRQNVKIEAGASHDFPAYAGLMGFRLWPKLRCNSDGNGCRIGQSGGKGQPCGTDGNWRCQAHIDTKFEASFGGRRDYFDMSLVDGYTLPFKLKLRGCSVKGGTFWDCNSEEGIDLQTLINEVDGHDTKAALVALKTEKQDKNPRSMSPDRQTIQDARRRSGGCWSVEGRSVCGGDSIEQLELCMAKVMADFRAQTEEAGGDRTASGRHALRRVERPKVLMQHLDALDEVQQSQEFEVANLMAEALQQGVLGRPPAQNNRKSTRARGKNPDPGGAWQAFMAWVPTGAAMQNPEPWNPGFAMGKPMPQNEIAQAQPPQSGKNRQVLKRNVSVLPGSPSEERPERPAKEDGDDSDSDSGRSTIAGEEQFELLELWRANEKQMRKMKRGSQAETESSMPFREEEDEYQEPPAHGWVLNPDGTPGRCWGVVGVLGKIRIGWDLGSLIMVLYDMVMIPMQAYALPENLFLDFMEWTTRMFWTFDICFSCSTGVVRADGSVEYDLRTILKRYAKTWLAMDLLIVCSDWSEVIFSSGGTSMLTLARSTRIIRIVRLLRLVRMQEIIANVTERIQSEALGPVVQVTKVTVVLLTISHFTGCLWFAIGNRDSSDTWVAKAELATAGVDAQYLASLHWALTQFSGGMDEIYPASPIERLFAVVIGLTIFVIALVLLGVFTSGLTQQYIIGGSGARQLATLKRYLKQNNVSKVITKRVCRNAKHAISGDLTPESVELLTVISEPLKVELAFDMYSQVLMWVPFFLDLLQENSPIMRPICHRAMSMLLLSTTDVIFSMGEEPAEPKMYIVVSGSLEYTDSYGELAQVTEKAYVAEAVLWTNWKHRGTLTAVSDVKLAMLDAQGFRDICQRFMRRSEAALRIAHLASSVQTHTSPTY